MIDPHRGGCIGLPKLRARLSGIEWDSQHGASSKLRTVTNAYCFIDFFAAAGRARTIEKLS